MTQPDHENIVIFKQGLNNAVGTTPSTLHMAISCIGYLLFIVIEGPN